MHACDLKLLPMNKPCEVHKELIGFGERQPTTVLLGKETIRILQSRAWRLKGEWDNWVIGNALGIKGYRDVGALGF